MVADLSQIDLDIIGESCTIYEDSRIIAHVFLDPLDMSLKIRSSNFISPQCLEEIADSGGMKISFGIQNTGEVSFYAETTFVAVTS